MDENIKKQLDDVCNVIDEKLEKSAKQIKDNVNNEVDGVIKGEVKNLVNKHTEMVDRLDKMEVENKKNNSFPIYRTKRETFADAINGSESLKAMKEGNRGNANIEFKADVLISTDFTGANSARDVTRVTRVEGIKKDPAAYTNLRDFIPVGSTDGNVIRFVKEASWTDNAAATAEGSAPTASEFALSANDAIVQKLTSVMTISQEMLDDTPALSSYLSQRVPAKINSLLDTQLLTGNGTSPNLQGLLDATGGGVAFDTASSAPFYQAIESAQDLDVIIVALNQLALANYQGSAIVLNPTDFHKMYLLKDTQNSYLRGNSISSAEGFFRINGVPVYVNNQMTAGKFIVGDFAQGSQIWQREGLNVAFGYEDSDNFSKYLVSVRGMMRIAHSIYSGNAYVWGTFSTAKTSLETA